ncbi:hypothetical protein NFI95_15445 [Acetobacteraceae bacterium KSS8]|uniref:Secreted protein n=1 Tax=Endosaccharibacter trunci TaxID=2812733 RepID=A0ABT1WAB5_9PROT|nr:hypothetical protein [Acetobacteraceae bacterium KSS8]
MSETTNTPSLGSMAAGLVTAAASSIVPVEKVTAAVEHGAETFIEHNEALAPVLGGAETTISNLAETHGWGTVWSIIEGLLPFLAGLHHSTPIVPATGGGDGSGAHSVS